MRPGGGSRRAQTPGIASSRTPATSSTPMTPRRFAALKRPMSGLVIAAAPQLDSRRKANTVAGHGEIARLEPVLEAARRRGPAREAVADPAHRPEREHVRDAHAERVVEVEHRVGEARRAEEPRLGLRVGLHVGVVFEVVARQVREQRAGEPRALEAALVEADRRRLQRDAGGACVAEAPHRLLQDDRRPGSCSGSPRARRENPCRACRSPRTCGRRRRAPARATGCSRSCRWCRSRRPPTGAPTAARTPRPRAVRRAASAPRPRRSARRARAATRTRRAPTAPPPRRAPPRSATNRRPSLRSPG